ncbi:MAG: D-aminoacyl-tRNA deacylase [Bacillota bacterium]|nr:D-aminoacyl-tRNA deacylase [Bacillota bacterium]
MKAVIQRVSHASVSVDGNIAGKIEKGMAVLVGISSGDTENELRAVAEKMVGLRIFSDEDDKMNLSLKEVGGKLMVISQFTLYADCRKGRRPSFVNAAGGEFAKIMYEKFVEICEELMGDKVETGIFGADMKVELLNDGPVTIILNSDELNIKKHI